MMKPIHKITSLEEFDNAINSSNTVIAYFYSNYCIDCVKIAGEIDSIQEIFQNYRFIKICREELLEIFKHYNVFGIPSIIIFSEGKIINQWISKDYKEVSEIIDFIKKQGDDTNVF